MFAFSSHGRCAGYVGNNRALANGARQYHAPSGAWHNPDRLAGNYPHLSPYTYCAGDPLNYIDPTGMDWIKAQYDDDRFYFWDEDIKSQDDIVKKYGEYNLINYLGHLNPRINKSTETYCVPPINSLDYAAFKHDKSYDKRGAKGIVGATLDPRVLDYDFQLIKDSYISIGDSPTSDAIATAGAFILLTNIKINLLTGFNQSLNLLIFSYLYNNSNSP